MYTKAKHFSKYYKDKNIYLLHIIKQSNVHKLNHGTENNIGQLNANMQQYNWFYYSNCKILPVKL